MYNFLVPRWVYPLWVLLSKYTSTLTGVYRRYYTDTRMSVPVWVLFSKDTSTLTGVYRWYYTDTRMSVLCWVLFFKDTPTLTGVYKGCYTYIGMTDENYAHKMERLQTGIFSCWIYHSQILILCYHYYARCACSRYASRYLLYTCTRAFNPR